MKGLEPSTFCMARRNGHLPSAFRSGQSGFVAGNLPLPTIINIPERSGET